MGAKLGVELAKSPIECDETEHTTYILTDVRKNDKGGGGGIGKVDSKNKDGKEELEESNEGKQKNTYISTNFLQIPKGGLDIVELKYEKCRGEKLSSLDEEEEEEMLWDRLFNLTRGWEEWSEESNNWTRVKSNHDRKKRQKTIDYLPDVGRVFHDVNEMEEDLYNRLIKLTEPIQGLQL